LSQDSAPSRDNMKVENDRFEALFWLVQTINRRLDGVERRLNAIEDFLTGER
jgi:hypothetical protein